MLNSSCNWINRFRFETENLKSQNVKIYNFINNHENFYSNFSDDYKVKLRDYKISYITSKNWKDPLDYLNQFIDVMIGKFETIMTYPSELITFLDKETNHLIQKTISAQSYHFKSIFEFTCWISDKEDSLVYPFLVKQENIGFTFRAGILDKESFLFSLK